MPSAKPKPKRPRAQTQKTDKNQSNTSVATAIVGNGSESNAKVPVSATDVSSVGSSDEKKQVVAVKPAQSKCVTTVFAVVCVCLYVCIECEWNRCNRCMLIIAIHAYLILSVCLFQIYISICLSASVSHSLFVSLVSLCLSVSLFIHKTCACHSRGISSCSHVNGNREVRRQTITRKRFVPWSRHSYLQRWSSVSRTIQGGCVCVLMCAFNAHTHTRKVDSYGARISPHICVSLWCVCVCACVCMCVCMCVNQ